MGVLARVGTALLALVAGCAFDPALSGRYACGVGSACPPGLLCAEDGLCRDPVDDGALDGGFSPDTAVVDLTPACTPTTCRRDQCGERLDDCGGVVTCATICRGAGGVCGGDGANRCGEDSCLPTTCLALGMRCGKVSDGCAAVLDCGPCS